MERYLVRLARTQTGYSAHCPDVPGCASVGDTPEETLFNLREALEFHFEGLAEDGLPLLQSGGLETYESTLADFDEFNEFFGYRLNPAAMLFAGNSRCVSTLRNSRTSSPAQAWPAAPVLLH